MWVCSSLTAPGNLTLYQNHLCLTSVQNILLYLLDLCWLKNRKLYTLKLQNIFFTINYLILMAGELVLKVFVSKIILKYLHTYRFIYTSVYFVSLWCKYGSVLHSEHNVYHTLLSLSIFQNVTSLDDNENMKLLVAISGFNFCYTLDIWSIPDIKHSLYSYSNS